MRNVKPIMTVLTTSVLLVFVATDTTAQRARSLSRDPVLRGNPKRDAGGSCVYDRDGKVVFAPAGKECRDRANHLVDRGDADSDLVGSFPPALQDDLSRLLGDHVHLSQEISRLRYLIREEGREEALKAAEKVSSEITEHTAREERFFEAVARLRRRR